MPKIESKNLTLEYLAKLVLNHVVRARSSSRDVTLSNVSGSRYNALAEGMHFQYWLRRPRGNTPHFGEAYVNNVYGSNGDTAYEIIFTQDHCLT